MIRKSLLIAVLVFAAYNLFLIEIKPQWSTFTSAYQYNIIKADRYLYSTNPPQSVMIGTSLSSRIITDSVRMCNLAFPGMSAADGLYILSKARNAPKLVFIEINYFYMYEREDFVGSFTSPIINFLKLKLPAIRNENQPISVSYSLIDKLTGHHEKLQGQGKVLNNPVLDTSLFSVHRKKYDRIDPAQLKQCVAHLKQYVDGLKSRGSQVCFFEMPVNSIFAGMPETADIRNAILKNFPQDPFIPVPNRPFVTTDGIHLGQKEAMDYTMYFKGKLHALGYL